MSAIHDGEGLFMKTGLILMVLTLWSWGGLLIAEESALKSDVHERIVRIKPHPRLFLTAEKFEVLRAHSKTDTVLKRYIDDVLKKADKALSLPPRVHGTKDGLRFGEMQSTGFVTDLAFAYRWTGDVKYKNKAVQAMTEVAAFPDWNPRHFLCTVGTMTGMSFGYDWLYDVLTPEERVRFSDAIIRLGLTPNSEHPTNRTNNWGGVCNGGVAIGALAIASDSPDLAERLIVRSVERFPRSMVQYAPDGAWYEGAGYWSYMTESTFKGVEALRVALDTDYGISLLPGVDKTAWFPIHAAGAKGFVVQFADMGDADVNNPKRVALRRNSFPVMFLLSSYFNEPAWAALQNRALEMRAADVMDVIYYCNPAGQVDPPLNMYFRGTVETFFMRSRWNDPNAWWVCVKGGVNNVPHGQLDGGNFEFEVNNVRWGYDLGADDYNMPGYFDQRENGNRWSYYRNNGESHNVMKIDGASQTVAGAAHFVSVDTVNASVTVDMKGVYGSAALEKYLRTVSLDGLKLTIKENLVLNREVPILWGMTTNADIVILPKGKARMICNGKKVIAEVIEPAGLNFSVGSCERKPPEKPNTGFRRLEIDFKAGSKSPVSLIIQFKPEI